MKPPKWLIVFCVLVLLGGIPFVIGQMGKPRLSDLSREELPLSHIKAPVTNVFGGFTGEGYMGLDAYIRVRDSEGLEYEFHLPHSGVRGKAAFQQVLVSYPSLADPNGTFHPPGTKVPMKDPARAKEICLLLLKADDPEDTHYMYYSLQSKWPPVLFMNRLRAWLRIP